MNLSLLGLFRLNLLLTPAGDAAALIAVPEKGPLISKILIQ